MQLQSLKAKKFPNPQVEDIPTSNGYTEYSSAPWWKHGDRYQVKSSPGLLMLLYASSLRNVRFTVMQWCMCNPELACKQGCGGPSWCSKRTYVPWSACLTHLAHLQDVSNNYTISNS